MGLVGHNGAGKSTTLMTITGALSPVGGEIVFDGQSIVGLAPDEILRRGIALVPEGRRIFGRLTVGENIKIGATVRKDRKGVDDDIRKMLERFPVLERYWNTSGAKLSGGEQQQLAIARALVSKPKLLLLDEPTLGLAPLMVDRVFEILEELHAERDDDPARGAECRTHDRDGRPDVRAAHRRPHPVPRHRRRARRDRRLRNRVHRDGLAA